MLFSCKCLNLTIRVQKPNDSAEANLLANINKLPNNLGMEQLQFFKQAIGPFSSDVAAITKEQSALVQVIIIDEWHLNRCINCKEIAFGVNELNQMYLVNSSLSTNPAEIEKIKSSSVYSNVYRVAMVQSEFMDLTRDKPSNVGDKPRIKNLQEQLHAAIQNETTAVEEKIRLFTEQQYAMLKMYRHRAEQEYHTLCSVINCEPEHIINIHQQSMTTQLSDDNMKASSLMETPPATPDNTPMSVGNSPPIGNATTISSTNNGSGEMAFKQHRVITPNKGKSLTFKTIVGVKHSNNFSQGHQNESSLDSDCIFELDGVAEPTHGHGRHNKLPLSHNMSDLEESDPEDIEVGQEAGVQIPGRVSYGRQSSVAKSLPITMPAVMTQFRTTEDDFEELPEDSNIDIAASIKALARSVHGEAIFGDLPRPRKPKFTTQI
uniref:CSON002818 protein n=1 Tax=Culicoides sonorensis TaxID=179676 RepID=A0A336K7Q6_CULSO